MYQRTASGKEVSLILTHGWPSSFLDYVDMLPMLDHGKAMCQCGGYEVAGYVAGVVRTPLGDYRGECESAD